MEAVLTMMSGLPMWAQAVLAVVALCKVITFWTPTKIDDAWFGKLTPMINMMLRGLNIGGLNIMKDQNKDDRK
jgi:hypothetical protein